MSKLLSREAIRLMRAPQTSSLYRVMYPGVSPVLSLNRLVVNDKTRPMTNISESFSDHMWYQVPNAGILAGNMMKQGSFNVERPNNAFKMGETDQIYTSRTRRLATTTANFLVENPHLSHFVGQEAPIKENFEEFKEAFYEIAPDTWECFISEYGILTMVDTAKFNCQDVSDDLPLTEGMDFRYKEARFRTIEISTEGEKPWLLTNLHAPHQDKTGALVTLLVNVLKTHLSKPGQKEVKHVLCGDWNASPEELDYALEEAYAQIQEMEDSFDINHPARVHVDLASMPEGHQKAVQPGETEPRMETVDGAMTITISPNNKYEYSSGHSDYSKKTSAAVGLVLLGAAGMMLINEGLKSHGDDDEDDDDAEYIAGIEEDTPFRP